MKSDALGISENLKTELERATYICITQAGNILLNELMVGGTLENYYGFGAELMLWDGNKFFYIDKLVYSFWHIYVNDDNSLTVGLSNVQAIYKNCGAFSVLQVMDLGPNLACTGVESKNTHVYLITPINDTMIGYDVKKIGRLPYEAQFWFTGIIIINPKKSIHAVLTNVSEAENEGSLISYQDGMIYINIGIVKGMIPQELFN